jgi:hypothetical protein
LAPLALLVPLVVVGALRADSQGRPAMRRRIRRRRALERHVFAVLLWAAGSQAALRELRRIFRKGASAVAYGPKHNHDKREQIPLMPSLG